MEPVSLEGVERILLVLAHPDDVDFGFAGGVATWTDAGIAVTYCIVTDGDAGGAETGINRAEMAALRRDEQRAAAAVVGVDDVRFLAYPDGRVEASLDLRRDISRVIRDVRPQRVVCQSPERNWDRIYASHPDHLAAGEAAVAAVYPDARNRWAHPELADEGFEPWSVDEMWVGAGAPGIPTHYTDITDAIDRKAEALCSHKSQIADPEGVGEMIRLWASGMAKLAGLPEGRYAEAVRVVNTR
ncbi:MAG TPA: PIG-L deacetylase family protein [Acidimicrobiia bacterium]|nr:PIG-L deacetylase family protein [Acidimicrobiia bacterium]